MRLINGIEEQLCWYQLMNSAPSDKNFRWNFNIFKKIPTNIYLIVNNTIDSTCVGCMQGTCPYIRGTICE
ncbi:MAG: hypothetical protein MJZ34_15025, partial [Paludibacteraceae bacterium]|nr:hypothetical protein [Paludibacteraceae bacterium]